MDAKGEITVPGRNKLGVYYKCQNNLTPLANISLVLSTWGVGAGLPLISTHIQERKLIFSVL